MNQLKTEYETQINTKVKPFFEEIFTYIIDCLTSTKQMHKRRYKSFGRMNMQHVLNLSREDLDRLEPTDIKMFLNDLGYIYPDWLKRTIKEDDRTAYVLYNNERHNYDEVEEKLLAVNKAKDFTGLRGEKDFSSVRRKRIFIEGAKKVAVNIDTIGRVPIWYSKLNNEEDRKHIAKSILTGPQRLNAQYREYLKMPESDAENNNPWEKSLPNTFLLHKSHEAYDNQKDFFKELHTAFKLDEFGTEGSEIGEKMSNTFYRHSYQRISHRPFYCLKVVETPISVLAHQEVACQLLHLLINLTSDASSSSPVFRDAISEVILDRAKELFELDIYLWKAARMALANLIWQSVYRKLSLRIRLGEVYARNYEHTLLDFMDDDHEETCSILNLGVQVCTTPSIAYAMIEKENGPWKICRILRDLMNQKPIAEADYRKYGIFHGKGRGLELEIKKLKMTPNTSTERGMLLYDFLDDGNLFHQRNMDVIVLNACNSKTVPLPNFASQLKIYVDLELIHHGRSGKSASLMDFSPPGTKPTKSDKQKLLESLDTYTYYGFTAHKIMDRIHKTFYGQIGYLLAQVPEKMNSTFKKKVLLFAVEFFMYLCKTDNLCAYQQQGRAHVQYENSWYKTFCHSMNIMSTTERVIKWLSSDMVLKGKFLDIVKPFYCKFLMVSHQYKYFDKATTDAGSLNTLHMNAARILANLMYNDSCNFSLMPILSQGSSKVDLIISDPELKRRKMNRECLLPLVRTVIFSQQVFSDIWVRQGPSLKWSNEKFLEYMIYCSDTDIFGLQLYFALFGQRFAEKKYEHDNRLLDSKNSGGFSTSKLTEEEKEAKNNEIYNSTLNLGMLNLLNMAGSHYRKMATCLDESFLNSSKMQEKSIRSMLDIFYRLAIEDVRNSSIMLLSLIQMLEERYNCKVGKNITPEVRYKRNLVHIFSTGEKKPSELKGYEELKSNHTKHVTEPKKDKYQKDLMSGSMTGSITETKKQDNETWETVLPIVAEKMKSDKKDKIGYDSVVKYQLKTEYLFHYNPYSKLFITSAQRSDSKKYQLGRRNTEEVKNFTNAKHQPFFVASSHAPQFKNGMKNLLLILRHENYMLYNTIFLPLREKGF